MVRELVRLARIGMNRARENSKSWEKAMDVIEELRADVEHSSKCYQKERFHSMEAAKRRAEELGIGLRDCTNDCSYHRKLAFLDRLREPTPEMKKALLDAPGSFTPVYFAQVFIAAAQERL